MYIIIMFTNFAISAFRERICGKMMYSQRSIIFLFNVGVKDDIRNCPNVGIG